MLSWQYGYPVVVNNWTERDLEFCGSSKNFRLPRYLQFWFLVGILLADDD